MGPVRARNLPARRAGRVCGGSESRCRQPRILGQWSLPITCQRLTVRVQEPPIESPAMLTMLLAFVVSLVATLWLVRRAKADGHRFHDHDLSGPQKFHSAPVPRVGGIGIVLGVLAGVGLSWARNPSVAPAASLLMLCAVPAFASGLTEDLTKTQSPRRRLFFTTVSAALAVFTMDAVISRTDIPGLDTIVAFSAGAALVTIFVVAGVANSLNIIDGFNGLASMCTVLMLVSIGYVAFQVGDSLILALALAGIGAVLGFFVWNFPGGLIFLGDGGAYLLGFLLSELGVLLIVRNALVSPLFPLLLCAYPIFETIFSIYRRRVLKGVASSQPDGIHLHTLIHRRLVRQLIGDTHEHRLRARNSMTSPYLWLLCSLSVIPAVAWWHDTAVLSGFLALFMMSYVVLYWRIVRFKVPKWLVTRH